MTLFKAGRLPVLAGLLLVLLMGFAGTSYGVIRFDAVASPTEVINTGRSEVTGSINLIVRGSGISGTSAGGNVQIGIVYTNPAMQIDNTAPGGIPPGGTFANTATPAGIVLIASPSLASVSIVSVENFLLNGQCSGRITINIPPGLVVGDTSPNPDGSIGDFIRIEGVRGRIDASLAVTPGVDLFVSLQSINDPAATQFTPDVVRIAKSFDGMNVAVVNQNLLLCFPTSGLAPNTSVASSITVTEGFARAFVDLDAGGPAGTVGGDGSVANDRVDSNQRRMGAPTNSTQITVALDSIPASVSGITFPTSVGTVGAVTGAQLVLVSQSFDATTGVAAATYSFEARDQVNESDLVVETFRIIPAVVLKAGSTQTGVVNAAVTLAPAVDPATGCAPPSGDAATPARPRFLRMFESDAVSTNNPPDDPSKPFVSIIRCNCYLLFTYVTSDSAYNTGIAIANTTGDTAVFGTNEAPDQLGRITFYFYDRAAGFVGSTQTAADLNAGQSFVGLISQLLPTGVTSFSGYVFAKADFQFCHGFAFIADRAFANIAQGYLANVVPDPAIKFVGRRGAAAAGDATNVPAGESLNN